MSKIFEMIKNEKIEWRKLGEVCEINKGKQLNKTKMIEDGEYPVINGGVSPSGYYNMFNTKKETITVSQGGASAGYVNFIKKNFWLGAHAFSVIPKNEIIDIYDYKYCSLNRYIYHILKMNQLRLQQSQEGAGIPSVSKKRLSLIEIPLVSNETQEKIVEILDNFSKYSAELQAELQNRSSQYEYFRDLVLSEDYLYKLSMDSYVEKNNQIIIKTLGDVAQINRGSSPRPISRYITEENDGVPWIKIGDTGRNSKYITKTNQKITKEGAKKSRLLKKGDFIISNSMSYGRPYILDIEGAIHDGWASISDYEGVLNSNYLYHYLNTSFVQKYWENKMNSSSVSNLNIEIIKSLPIPILTKDLQIKVSNVLDKFQDLLADTEGLLPKEIEQRQKQYEYFREKLLTFDKDAVSQPASQPLIASCYFESLHEACDILGIKYFSLETKKLEEICEYTDGTHQTPKYQKNGIPFISVENIKDIYNSNKFISEDDYKKYKYKPEKGDLFMTRIGDIGTCTVLDYEIDLAYYVTLALIKTDKSKLNSQFLKFFIESVYGRRELNKRILHNANPIKINLSDIGKIKILVPPLPVQDHIVKILDKFDTLVNDLNYGLPKEIDLRQKQYEYYREILLNFRK